MTSMLLVMDMINDLVHPDGPNAKTYVACGNAKGMYGATVNAIAKARAAGVPIIPIAHNAGECWPRRAFVKKPGMVTVSIGPLIQTSGLSASAVNEQVEQWIEGEMRVLNPERYAGE